MNEEMLFQQMRFIRQRTLAALDATPEEMLLTIPEGFNNNLLWNYAHIYVTLDNLMYSFLNEKHTILPHYLELFSRGSSPTYWNGETPPISEIREFLVSQPDRIVETFAGRLSEKGEKPFTLGPTVQFTTLGEILGFANFHEGVHQGSIIGLKRALGIENLRTPVTGK